jgi:hypothetical protein
MKAHIAGALCAVALALTNSGLIAAQDSIATSIALNGSSITVDGAGATADGSIVTISTGGTYTLSGSLDDGHVIVETEEAVTLVLDNVTLASSTSAPISINSADSVTLVLPEGTENTVTDAATYIYPSADVDEPNAAIFSNDDLIIEGDGSLTVQANYNDGISTDDSLTISGNPTITVTAADDAIRGKDSLTISGGTFTLNAAGDTLKSDNTESVVTIDGGTYTLTAGDDGIQSDRDLTINAGTFTITAGGDGMHAEYNLTLNGGEIDILNSEEGIEAAFITLNDGDIHVTASDDAINASAPDDAETTTSNQRGGLGDPNSPYYLHINGGTLVADAEGDGLDANGSIEMTGGLVIVNGPLANNNGALDYDGTFNISGGTLVAVGSAGMPSAPSSDSSQNALLINFDAAQTAGTLVHIGSTDGETLLTFAPGKNYQSLVFSSPDLTTGNSYEVYIGGSADGDSSDGLYTNDDAYSDGTLNTSFTVSSSLTQIGNVRRMRG